LGNSQIFLAKQREQEKLLLLSLESLRTRLPAKPADTLLRKETAPGRMGTPILPEQYVD